MENSENPLTSSLPKALLCSAEVTVKVVTVPVDNLTFRIFKKNKKNVLDASKEEGTLN